MTSCVQCGTWMSVSLNQMTQVMILALLCHGLAVCPWAT